MRTRERAGGTFTRLLLVAVAGAAIAASTGCFASSKHVALLSATGVPLTSTPSGAVPLEVVTRGTSVPDPLHVRGSGVDYSDVEAALGLAVSSACVPWANQHKKARPEGWQLFVELTRAEAEESSGRFVITLEVRATLRGRAGSVYLAQTQAHCLQSGLVSADEAGPVVYACMSRVGRDLSGWLEGVEP